MFIRFCGATTGVTGSCHLLEIQGRKLLLDCGQFQGGKAQDALNREAFPFDPASVDAVILTHGHIDHCGRLPLLVKYGFRGTIYTTKATADLLPIMLLDCGHIQEADALQKNRKRERAGKPLIEPLYTVDDAKNTLPYIKGVDYHEEFSPVDGVVTSFYDAGHILGSAIASLEITENGHSRRLVFSGDLGVKDRPILRDPEFLDRADIVIMESTYGSRLHPPAHHSIKQLMDIIIDTTERGGTVVIPSFAVGRTQEIIYQLNKYYDTPNEFTKHLQKIKVYVDSPMASNATEVFKKHVEVYDKESYDYLMKGDDPLAFDNLIFTKSTDESIAINQSREPKIIISASGMCEAGRIRHHLKHNIWRSNCAVVFVGYQAVGTLGRYILEGADHIKLFGEEIIVKAKIFNLEGLSGHADQQGLLEWLGAFSTSPKVFLVHGEPESKLILSGLIREELGFDVKAITENRSFFYDLKTGHVREVED